MASPWERMRAGEKSALPSGYKGPQPGGIASIPSSSKKDAFVELQRRKFFDNRPDVTEDRILRRTRQEGGVNQFKQSLIDSGRVLKDSKGNIVMNSNTGEPVYLTDVPGGRTVGDVSRDFAYRFGPTFPEIGSDIKYAASNMFKGLGDFVTSGGITGALFRTAKDLFTNPVGTAKNMYYGAQDMMKGYNPLTKSTVAPTPEIKAEPLPGLDLEAKMSAYSDPSAYYASLQEQKPKGDYLPKQDQNYYQGKPSQSPTGNQYLYADAGDAAQNYMQLLKNVQNLGNTQYGNFGVKDILSNPTLTYEKEIGPGTLSGTIGDNKASLGYSMIFNKGGRVRGTGIMGAL